MEFAGLRIGLVGPLPPPEGGMANQTRQLAEFLRRGGAEVEVVRSNPPCRPRFVARLRGVREIFRLAPYLLGLWRAGGRCDLFHVMANSGWSWHLIAAPAIWIGRARGVPTIVNYRGGEAAAFLQRSPRSIRASMKHAAELIVPSAYLQHVFDAHDLPARVVPNIVDLSHFQVGAGRAEPGLHLVVARHLESIYDNATALRAFRIVLDRHPAATLTIAGIGPEAARLHKLANELRVTARVRFAGKLDRDAMAELYRSADVSLNPSRVDNMPNSVLEAMACGVPVVSTDVGGIPYFVQDGTTALLVPPGDPARMADAVLQLVDDRRLRDRIVQAGLREVQRYTWERVGPQLRASYRSAIELGGRQSKVPA